MLRTETGQLAGAALLLVLIMMGFTLFLPTPTQAFPSLGLTPTPTATLTPTPPPPTEPTDEPSLPTDGTSSPDDGGSSPDNEVEVAVSCTCTIEADPLTFSVPIQLIHQGSGWIAEATLSNIAAAKLLVPYAGTWDVFMTGPPQFNRQTEATFPSSYPAYLGTVQANSGPQIVNCPTACEELPIPNLLPETGNNQTPQTPLSPVLILSGFIFLSIIINSLAKFVDPQIINIKLK